MRGTLLAALVAAGFAVAASPPALAADVPLPKPVPPVLPVPIATPAIAIPALPPAPATQAPAAAPAPAPAAPPAPLVSEPPPAAPPTTEAASATTPVASTPTATALAAAPVAAVDERTPSLQGLLNTFPAPLRPVVQATWWTLPLALAVWLLLLHRTLREGRSWRLGALRMAVAGELGIRPRDLAGLTGDALRELHQEAALDDVTGVLRRGAGMAALERMLAAAIRHRRPLSVAFVDLDGLKETNDVSGHAAGDQFIAAVARLLRDRLREEDLVIRYGGDEFVAVLSEANAGQARTVLEGIRAEADRAGHPFSLGVAGRIESDTLESLLARADDLLYADKTARHAARR